jgi:hypothetical protein
MRIDSSGNVGIGTTSPANTLSLGDVGSLGQDTNTMYVGANFTSTGVNYRKTGNYAVRQHYDSALGVIRFDNAAIGTAGNPISWSERMRIASSGNVGIGANSPTNGKLEIQETATTAALWVQTGGTTNSYTIADFRTGTNASAFAIFGNTTAAFSATVAVGAATPSASGAGITFPATQSASSNANTLDDYEEGTWTPVLQFDANTQTLTTTYGTYVKIGKSVSINMSISWAAKSGSGRVYITGLPFAKEATGTIALLAGCNAGGVTTTEALFYNLDGSGTILNLAQQSGDISSASINTSGNLFCSGTYFV